MNVITGEQLKKELDEGCDVKLVFVLGEWSYRAKHIPGSLHIETPEKATEVLGKKDAIVVYCAGATCPASIYAYHQLVGKGYVNVRRFAGGLEEWEAAGYPLEGEMAESR